MAKKKKGELGHYLDQINLNASQKEYLKKIINNQIVFCSGPAGTAKTFIACYAALHNLEHKSSSQVILSKPIQEAGEKLGHLPGEKDDKIAPYMSSYYNNIKKIIGTEWADALFYDATFSFQPLAYMRGDTFDRSLMILDEAQNATFDQLILFLTRIGHNSTAIVTGDVSQYDLQHKELSLPKFIELMQSIDGIEVHNFDQSDIVRSDIVQKVVSKYEQFKAKQ